MDKNKYWKSLRDYEGSEELENSKKNEFEEGVTEEFDISQMDGLSRRRFLALLAASSAVAATACSDYRDKGEIVPYNQRPENVLPGKANYYASTCDGCSQHCGILIKTREGRPIKIDGNEEHPVNKGKICSSGHANILNLYDPERLKNPVYKKRRMAWDKIVSQLRSDLNAVTKSGKKIAVVSNTVSSPLTEKVFSEFKNAYPTAEFFSYELFDHKNKVEAAKRVFGVEAIPVAKFDKAKIILSINDDFLARGENTIESIRNYAKGRNIEDIDNFNRLYVVEGGLSLTGSNADYRIRLRPDAHYQFLLALYNELAGKLGKATISNGQSLSNVVKEFGLDNGKIQNLVSDLLKNSKESLITGSASLSVDALTVIYNLNNLLNSSALLDFENPIINANTSSADELKTLVEEMNKGNVGAFINFGTDPVYHLSSLDFATALANVNTKVSFNLEANDTSALCDYVLADHHGLESWNIFSTRPGLFSMMQPVINPIFDTKQKEEVLLALTGNDSDILTYAKDYFKNEIYPKTKSAVPFEKYWFSALHDGAFTTESNLPKPKFNSDSIKDLSQPAKVSGNVVEVQPSYFVGDGKFANNGWLQELPHPVAKVTWDNFVSVSPSTAKKLNAEIGSVLELSVNGKKVKMPAMVQPGVADDTFVVEAGYGRKVIGDVGKDAGFDVNVLLNKSLSDAAVSNGVDVSNTGEEYKLVSTQEHHSLDDDFVKDFHKIRKIIIENTVDEYKKDPHFIEELPHEELPSITRTFEYKDVKWGMSIDLNKCIACGVCVSSCNVENNVPVVGKDQVAVGREMQWMRIDRYYSGTPDEPVVSNQPMLCQHCDSAPCENVCPVNATNHSPDGLNQMVYNRCVGTRYCSNNCPYKVRRFNFFNFRDHFADAYYENELTALVNNPEVTVRSRGVMEKCTFCIQRIMEARSEAIAEGKEFTGEGVKTACQVACPSEAIEFGNYNDKTTKIAKLREHELGYHVLQELNVRPNVTYLAKLRNTLSEEA